MSRLILVFFCCALALPAAAGDCPSLRLSLPGRWIESAPGGIRVFRSATAAEALTVAGYALKDQYSDVRGRTEYLLKWAQLGRAQERAWAGDALTLTPAVLDEAGGWLRLRYSGHDRASGRRFVSVALSAPACTHHVHYEALDASRQDFDGRARQVFDGIRAGSVAMNAQAPWRAALGQSMLPRVAPPLRGLGGALPRL